MKRFLLLVAATSLFFVIHSSSLFAQETDTDPVVFNAYLLGAFELYVNDGGDQTATFQTAEDYNSGISEDIGAVGIVPGFTTISMDATGNWHLEIMAQQDFMPVGGATGSIPINNLGVWCAATGTHQFGTEVTCNYTSADQALGLATANAMLIDLAVGNSNAGTPTENTFVLHWLMGTMQGSMNNLSMFNQLANGVFSKGQFTTTLILTLTEIP